MDLDEAKRIVSDFELNRWRTSISKNMTGIKPRIFALANLRANNSVNTIRGPLNVPPHVTNELPEWCFFADDIPNANWEHKCRYLIVYGDRSIAEVESTVPPDSNSNSPIEEVRPFII